MRSLWLRSYEQRLSRLFKTHIAALAACLLWGALGNVGHGCPFYGILGIGCPVCGTTRALCALANGDVYGYLSFQPFALLLPVATWGMIHCKGRSAQIVCGCVFLCNFIRWAVRLG